MFQKVLDNVKILHDLMKPIEMLHQRTSILSQEEENAVLNEFEITEKESIAKIDAQIKTIISLVGEIKFPDGFDHDVCFHDMSSARKRVLSEDHKRFANHQEWVDKLKKAEEADDELAKQLAHEEIHDIPLAIKVLKICADCKYWYLVVTKDDPLRRSADPQTRKIGEMGSSLWVGTYTDACHRLSGVAKELAETT